MRMSAKGLAELAGHEGIVNERYRDSVGVWTIGVGHTAAAGPPDPKGVGDPLTVGECLELFLKDVQAYEDDVNAAVKVPITQAEFDALVSFHYNTGRIRTAALTGSLNRGERDKAAAQFMNFRTPSEVVGRRTKEMLLFRDGKYSNGGKANVYPADTSGRVLWSQGKQVDVLSLWGQSHVAPAPEVDRPTIRRGSKGPDVAYWQAAAIGVRNDGDFGPVTEKATKSWQQAHGLVPDGVVGPKTWSALEKEIG